MALYEMTPDFFRPLSRASFADQRVRERDDLQRLLRTQIEVLGDNLYVLAVFACGLTRTVRSG